MFSFFVTLRRTALPACLLMLLLLPLAGCGTKEQNAQKVQETLAEAYRHAQVDATDKQARQWVDRAIAVDPANSSTYLGTSNPSLAGLQLSIALIFGEFGTGDDPALADYMQQATQKFPQDYRGYKYLAEALGRLGREPERKATAAKLVSLLTTQLRAPGATDIEDMTLALAQAYWDAGDPAHAIALSNNAITAYPADPGPPNNLAYAYAVSNSHLLKALTLSNQAITKAHARNAGPEEMATYQDTLAWVQYRLAHYAEAEQLLQQAANALPRLAEIRYHLGMVYAAEGKTEAARAEFGHAILLAQGYAAAQSALDSLPKSLATSS